jgi:hypothetical protein
MLILPAVQVTLVDFVLEAFGRERVRAHLGDDSHELGRAEHFLSNRVRPTPMCSHTQQICPRSPASAFSAPAHLERNGGAERAPEGPDRRRSCAQDEEGW